MPVRRLSILSLASLLAVPSLALARQEADPQRQQQQQPSIEELQAQIRQLQSRIDQLESRNTGPDPAVVNETVSRVIEDADRRSQLLQIEGFTAGFANNKFFIGSADGNWSFQPGIMIQFRNTTNFNTAGDDSVENGFELRRVKLNIQGNAISPALEYYVQWDTNRDGGGLALDDAFLEYNVRNDWFIKGGQYYDPWLKEQNIGDGRQLAAERSLINTLIGGAQTFRVQGVSGIYRSKRMRAEVMFNDGANSLNTTFREDVGGNAFVGGGQNWGASARFDYTLIGELSQIEDFTPMGNRDDLMAVGAGASYTEGGDERALFHTVDFQYKGSDRWSAYAALIGVARDVDDGTATLPPGNFYDWGVLVQGSYMFDERTEVFVRYDYTMLDDEAQPAGTDDEVHELTLGTNYYRFKHKLKFTVDGTWLPNGSPVSASGLGILAGDDDQFVLRAQVNFSL